MRYSAKTKAGQGKREGGVFLDCSWCADNLKTERSEFADADWLAIPRRLK
jgi:hypothetical protein